MDKLFRQLPIFKGKEKLSKLIFSPVLKTKKNIEITGRHGCKYLLPNITESIGFDLFINGTYEPEIQEMVNKLLPQNGCLIDAGANIGSIVIPIAKRRPDINAVAIEAAPWVYSYLEQNVQKNDLKNIRLVNNALFDEDDKDLDFVSPKDNFGQGSLSKTDGGDVVKVKSKKLDTIAENCGLKKVDVIKVDVEGFEYFVFKGAGHLLSRPDAPDIIFEFGAESESEVPGLEPGAAQRLLIEFGYTIYKIQGGKLTKNQGYFNEGYYNLLASKKEKPGML